MPRDNTPADKTVPHGPTSSHNNHGTQWDTRRDALQITQSRAAIQNYGRLDDQEFEQFAKALCVADRLDDDPNDEPSPPMSRIQWPEFLDTVNALLHPKKLLPLSRRRADQLRIQLPSGDVHAVPDLSSGARQALVIISRVLRAGAGHSVVVIDEPDAYLHPNLSQRLIESLQRGTGSTGQLIVATHSPAIVDRISTDSIVRLNYDSGATRVGGESGLIELYRTTGFKASALTQSELLVVTEGDSDDVVVKAMFPSLGRTSVQQGQGRRGVIQRVKRRGHTKWRSVPFPAALADELAAMMVGRGRDKLVFTDLRGGVLRNSN